MIYLDLQVYQTSFYLYWIIDFKNKEKQTLLPINRVQRDAITIVKLVNNNCSNAFDIK